MHVDTSNKYYIPQFPPKLVKVRGKSSLRQNVYLHVIAIFEGGMWFLISHSFFVLSGGWFGGAMKKLVCSKDHGQVREQGSVKTQTHAHTDAVE